MSINERIKYVIDVLQAGSRKDFAKKVGISAAQVYNIIGVNGKIGEKNLSKILIAYPSVSQPWLRSEEGAMLTDGSTPAAPATEKVARVKKAAAVKAPKTPKAPKVPKAKKVSKRALKKAAEAGAKPEAATLVSKTRKAVTPRVKKIRSKKEIIDAAVEEQKIKIAVPKKGRVAKIKEPKLAAPKKIDIPAEGDSKPATAINALIAGQRELITTNTKLVEANQQLVDLVLKMVKK